MKERGATTVPEVPVNRGTLIVAVDEIMESPQMLRAFEGQDITVQLGEGQRVEAGQQRILRQHRVVGGGERNRYDGDQTTRPCKQAAAPMCTHRPAAGRSKGWHIGLPRPSFVD